MKFSLNKNVTSAYLLLLTIAASAQTVQPPIPADRLEVASGDAQAVQDVAQRAAIVSLMARALRQSNIRTVPYDLKTSFTAVGNSSSDGAWKLRDTATGQGTYRWTAEGPSFSAVNLIVDRVLYSNQPASVPLRLAQARAAIFFKPAALGASHAVIRTVNGNLEGTEVTCALVSHFDEAKGATGPRRWEEREYCVEPKSANLISYSIVPGMYVLFNYSKAIHFHEKVFPGSFILTQGGQTVIEAQFESVMDPPALGSALYQQNGLSAIGVGGLMTEPWRFPVEVTAPKGTVSGAGEMVVIHAMGTASGDLSSAEVITSTNSTFNHAALQYVAGLKEDAMKESMEPGSTPHAGEVIFTVHYVNGTNEGEPQ